MDICENKMYSSASNDTILAFSAFCDYIKGIFEQYVEILDNPSSIDNDRIKAKDSEGENHNMEIVHISENDSQSYYDLVEQYNE